MAHFIGRTGGGRGGASRLGTKKSGISATAGGDVGGSIWGGHNETAKADRITLGITGGSNGANGDKTVAVLWEAFGGDPAMLTLIHPLTGEELYNGPAWKE